MRERLYAARAARVWPITDDKVLADWNGMVLRAFAEAGRLLGRDDFVDAARRLAAFLLDTMVRDLRPQATIEVETLLGAVIGAHAGPGTVGFFWFTDVA